MPQHRPKNQIPPVSTGVLKIDTAINAELALYHRTGNMLALWAAFGLCARAKVPLPDELIARLGEIADKLLKYAVDDVPRARVLVADAVLGTRNESGGQSLFEDYRLAKRDTGIVARVFALLAQDCAFSRLACFSHQEKHLRPGLTEYTCSGPPTAKLS